METEVVFSRIPLKGQQSFTHSLNLLSVFLNGAFHLVDFTPRVMKLALEFFKAGVEVLNWLDILSNAVSFSFTLAFKFEMRIQFPPIAFLYQLYFLYIFFWLYIGKKHH